MNIDVRNLHIMPLSNLDFRENRHRGYDTLFMVVSAVKICESTVKPYGILEMGRYHLLLRCVNPGSVHVGFVVDKVALGQVFLQVHLFSPVNFIPPVLH
jgi:hypothetical protein